MFSLALVCVFIATISPTHGWVPAMENLNLFQGDMVLSPAQRYFYTHGKSKAFGSIKDVTRLWAGGVVPYTITESLEKNEKAMHEINEAFKQYHTYTCIRFVKRTTQKSYIKFYQGSSCSSEVGRKGFSQFISLGSGCWWRTVIMHEIAHALGFEHEQARPDRDKYVEIMWGNLDRSVHDQFRKLPESVIDSLGTPYDLRSMMHYAWNSFSKKMSIRTKDPRDQYIIGQRDGFSHIDVKQINLLYKCKGTYPTLLPYVRPPPDCYDISPFCAKNKNDGRCEQGSWRWFMSKECRLTCGLCGHTTERPGIKTTNGITKTILRTHQQTTLSTRPINSTRKPTSGGICKDRVSNCRIYPRTRCSSSNPSWKYYMERSCKKYCGFC